jgi:hypothetical protein
VRILRHSAISVNEHTERRSETRQAYRLSGPVECIECGATLETHAPGWRGYRIDEPDTDDPPAVAFYFAYCAIREFG